MPDVSLASLALRLAVSMGVVIALMMLAAKLLRRAQAVASGAAAKGGRGGKVTRIPIAVTTVAPLTRGASVAIVRAAGREMVLGVTETQVTLLHSGYEPRDSDDDLIRIDDSPALNTESARIADTVPALPQDAEDGKPAWTDAIETLRAMTVRR